MITTVILIRHGERQAVAGNNDPHLSPDGRVRAKLLLHVLGNANLSTIYTSEFVRTIETAQPLASELGLTSIQAPDAQQIKEDILSNHSGETVLVVGHTSTIPELIQMLGDNNVHEIKDHEFDNMFLATIVADNSVRVTRLKYGKQT
jgi:2,3-bisphosphoglycerate-dependent phosphoglycerate mutase